MTHSIRPLLLAALILLAAPSAHAGGVAEYLKASVIKFAHGAVSVVYAPIDLLTVPVASAVLWDRTDRAALGFALGLPTGVVNGVARGLYGGYEAATFLFVDVNVERPFSVEPIVTGWDLMHAQSRTLPAFAPARRSVIPSRDF